MTEQTPDRLRHQGTTHLILSAAGDVMVSPGDLGLFPMTLSTASLRGYRADYVCDDGHLYLAGLTVRTVDGTYGPIEGVEPSVDAEHNIGTYTDLQVAVPFSGGLLVANALREPTRGLRLPFHYATVKEFLFESGALTAVVDHSDAIGQMVAASPKARATAWQALVRSFAHDYDLRYYWTMALAPRGRR
jgi:hypothetical protein